MSNFKQRVCPKKKLIILTFSFFLFFSLPFSFLPVATLCSRSSLLHSSLWFFSVPPPPAQLPTDPACPTPTHPFSKEESSVRRLHRRRERAFQRHQSKPISGTLRFSPKVYLPRSKPMWNFVHWGWVWCSVVCACEILVLVVALGLIELVDL